MIKESYKINRRDDDLNQPLSVQPWGEDGIGRVYWLIEGQDDTSFRLYRETNYKRQEGNKWISIVGSIDELRGLTQTLKGYKTQAAERLSDRTIAALPRFEATEEVSKHNVVLCLIGVTHNVAET